MNNEGRDQKMIAGKNQSYMMNNLLSIYKMYNFMGIDCMSLKKYNSLSHNFDKMIENHMMNNYLSIFNKHFLINKIQFRNLCNILFLYHSHPNTSNKIIFMYYIVRKHLALKSAFININSRL